MEPHDILVSLSSQLELFARATTSPRMPLNMRAVTIADARKELRWLRNLAYGDDDAEVWFSRGAVQEHVHKAESLVRLVEVYAIQLAHRRRANAEVMKDIAVASANDACCAFAVGLMLHAVNILPPEHPQIGALSATLDTLPDAWELRIHQNSHYLIDLIEAGLEHISGSILGEKPPEKRLAEASQRIENAAINLRGTVDTMRPPAREESIELAREILRRLRNMKFSDKTAKEMVDVGRPEEKAAFANDIGDVVDTYQDTLYQATQMNPDILQDTLIKDASDSASTFAYGVKLMAAKEMPGSVAAAQQISAEATLDPKEWDQLHDRTVGRLAKSMEGGIERAAADMEIQQQQQEHAQDQAQEAAAEMAQQQSDGNKRRRRRRSRRSAGGGAARKQERDLRADDYVLKQHPSQAAATAKTAEKPAILQGMKAEDLAAIKALGGSLNSIGQQAKELANSLPQKTPDNNKIAPDDDRSFVGPDDRNFATRTKDQRDQDKNNKNKNKNNQQL